MQLALIAHHPRRQHRHKRHARQQCPNNRPTRQPQPLQLRHTIQTIIAGKQSSSEAFDSAINPHNTPNTNHRGIAFCRATTDRCPEA